MNRNKKVKPHKTGLILLVLSVSIFLLPGCASRAAVKENQLYAYLTDNSRFTLLSPAGIEKTMDMAQYVSASYRGRNYFMNAWILADESGMEMTLLNELGAGMGVLSYRDGVIKFSSPVFPENLGGEYIVADFQLCFYDPLLLQKALKECGLTFEASGNSRRILHGKDLIIEIEKYNNSIKLTNHLRGYSYTLEGDYDS